MARARSCAPTGVLVLSLSGATGGLLSRSAGIALLSLAVAAFLLYLAPAAFLLSLAATPARANVAPEAMVHLNVRPHDPPGDYCLTNIEYCSQMGSSTPEAGELEFQIFIDPQQWMHGEIPVARFATQISWPASWTYLGGDVCRDGYGYLDYLAPELYYLDIEWPCTIPDGLFLAATLAFDVPEYGRFDLNGSPRLWLGCPPDTFVLYPTSHFAEAGTGCEFTNQPCATHYLKCVPSFPHEKIELQAAQGGWAHAEMPFTAGGDIYPQCSGLHVDYSEPWIQASLLEGASSWEWILVVDADATGLEPGVYQSELQVEWQESTARCLQAVLTVEDAAAVDPFAGQGASPASGELRLTSANPSDGPFVFLYQPSLDGQAAGSGRGRPAPPVRAGVYDAVGREVAELRPGDPEGRQQSVVWDGLDSQGRPATPGVYLIRLEAEGKRLSTRVVVVR